jgi:hypothetical protein
MKWRPSARSTFVIYKSCLNKLHLRTALGKSVEAIKIVSKGAEADKPLLHQLMGPICKRAHWVTATGTAAPLQPWHLCPTKICGAKHVNVSHSGAQPCTSHLIETLMGYRMRSDEDNGHSDAVFLASALGVLCGRFRQLS